MRTTRKPDDRNSLLVDYPLGGLFGGMDTVGNADAVIGVAAQCEVGKCRRAGLDPLDQILMSNVILRHSPRPTGEAAVDGWAVDT